METIIRNATSRFHFILKEDPANFANAVAVFKQGGRIVLWKDKDAFTVDEENGRDGKRWIVNVDLTPEESRRFNPVDIGFAHIVGLRDYGVQDPGEIVEFEVVDSTNLDLTENEVIIYGI